MGCVKKAGRDEPEEEEGMERVIEVWAGVASVGSGETHRPDEPS